MNSGSDALATLLLRKHILVTVGTGGVGKTTVAAALAVEAARQGRRVLALTVDPARRLCDALGLSHSQAGRDAGDVRSLDAEARAQLGISDGRLDAVMLDMKSTFDGLVNRFAKDEATRMRILQNPIYQHVSDALAGSGEYAAMEKVFEVWETGRYDLIVLDTPPSEHALDFLDAPRRLLEFLDSRLVQLLFHPAMAAGRFSFKIWSGASQKLLQMIERVTGIGFLEDISEFLLAFESMSDGFRERGAKVQELLLGESSAFLVVAGPTPEAARSAFDFLAQIKETGVPVAGVIINRMRLWPESETPDASWIDAPPVPEDIEVLARALAKSGDGADDDATLDAARTDARTAIELTKGYASLVRSDERSTRPLRELTARSGQLLCRVPELPTDVADLDGLIRVGDWLFRTPRDA